MVPANNSYYNIINYEATMILRQLHDIKQTRKNYEFSYICTADFKKSRN